MRTTPIPPTSPSNLDSIFASAFRAYKKKTGKDITSHPLAAELQSCNSPDTVLALLQRQLPVSGPSQSGDERFTKWLIPTVNVLYSFSATLAGGAGLVFPPANAIFTGIGVLLSAAEDVSADQETLINMFNRIEYFFRRLEIYTEVSPTTAMTDIIVDVMTEILTIVALATKEMRRGRFKKYLRKMMENTDVEDSLQRLDTLTQEEARMASAELLKVAHSVSGQVMVVDDRVKDVEERVGDVSGDVREVGKRVGDVDDRVQGVSSNVQDITDRMQGVQGNLDQANRNQLRDRLLQWLSPPDPSTNHNIACKAHHSDTAQWFFQGSIFSQWKSTASFLWIHGKPGSGKSTLCSSVIQDILPLRDAKKASVAFFYFDFRDVDKQKLHNLLPSLLIQFSAQSDPYCDVLSRLRSDHDRGVRKPSDRAMTECLKEMVTLQGQGRTYIILDALDESPNLSGIPSSREEVLEFVNELVNLHLPNLHICVTSRPELDIQAVLQPLSPCTVSLHEESGQMTDIIEYVSSVVHSDRTMRRWRQEDKDLVIKTLSERADGMFRWVFCQLEVLRHCFPPSVRRVLEELPESLDGTYERILREIKKTNRRHTHRLLQCLVVAVRPLSVKELAEVLAVDFNPEGMPKLNPDWRWADQEQAVLSACSSLISIVYGRRGSKVVQFSHFSVKEFLTSSRLAESSSSDVWPYHILPEPAHTVLAQACLGVLLRLDDRLDHDSIESFPMARYAARYWPTHARFGNVSSRIKDGMGYLFDTDKPHFATWLWIYNEESYQTTTRPEKPNAIPLYYASRLGLESLVEHFIAKNPEDVNVVGGLYRTPLHVAAAKGRVKVALSLLKHLPVNIKSTVKGRTPLHNAAMEGGVEIGKLLLNHGADVNAQQDDGYTPLHLAVFHGRFELSRLLPDHGANVHAQNQYGDTPARVWSNVDEKILQLLSEYGAKSTGA